ncbi:hypothetical protein HDU79_009215 [Rhizoclosmatium sp. JEL0117]|nr:hypothetical protein HDU79_009215 [Rhizoclosmatium sp. JEL0117]
MAPQPELIVALKPDAQIYNFTAGAYERTFYKVNDCDFIPQPADLKCLDFSINNFSYNSTRLDFSPQGPVRSNLVWKDTTSCSGDFAARINATYGYALDGDVFSQIRPNERTNVIERIQLSFYLKKDLPPKPAVDTRAPPPRPYCTLPYISSSVPYFGNEALLAEKQPVCGPNAPKWNSSSNYPPYAFSVVQNVFTVPDGSIAIVFGGRNIGVRDLAAAYSVNSSTIAYKFISATKFSIVVPSKADDLSAENSCVYNYRTLVVSETKGRNYTLAKVTQGTIPLKANVSLADGCIDGLVDFGANGGGNGYVGNFGFTGNTTLCGSPQLQSRLNRYFDLETYFFSFNVLSAGQLQVSVSETEKSSNLFGNDRRDGLTDFTFSYVDNAAFATTATTTVAATSTFASSTVSTVTTVAKSASASGSGSAAASATVVVTTTAAAAVPTAYVAPAVPAYGAPANNNNNLYKGAAVEKVGVFAALLVAVFLA